MRDDYPRPQMTRGSYMLLNGEWDFAFDFGNTGAERRMQESGVFDRKIRVPFCPESRLSGIGYTDFIAAAWYRRTVTLTEAQLRGRVFLHFGAVDYFCQVWCNGAPAGSHKGGYSSFKLELTGLVHPGENVLVVNVQDDLRSGRQPHGKQSRSFHSRGCSYTRTTGIWQTVWLEFTPDAYIDRYQAVPLASDGAVRLSVFVDGATGGARVRMAASYRGKPVGEASAAVAGGVAEAVLPLSEVHLWDVGRPELYDLTLELIDGGAVRDAVGGYFGLRTVEARDGALYLNGRPVFMRMVLDQGFNPDGVYTAPDDAFLKHDIELSMRLGFNGARLHQRVFEERTLYWADRLGYLVWGEYANGSFDEDGRGLACFLPEWLEVVRRDHNHPSVIGWCPFNEMWNTRLDPDLLKNVYRITKTVDPTRPVIDCSGGMHYDTDLMDVHEYQNDPEKFRALFEQMKDDPGAIHNPIHSAILKNIEYRGQPYWVSEYGGAFWNPGAPEGAWGYRKDLKSEEEFAQLYSSLTRALLEHPRICGFCYTQLTDVEQEQNGLYRYDRSDKFRPEIYEIIRAANTAPASCEQL